MLATRQLPTEFDPEYSAFLLEKRRAQYGEMLYQEALSSLHFGHDGARMAHLMLRFIEQA